MRFLLVPQKHHGHTHRQLMVMGETEVQSSTIRYTQTATNQKAIGSTRARVTTFEKEWEVGETSAVWFGFEEWA